MERDLALDLTRLFLSPMCRTPRGIDRVEFAYAEHFLNNWPGNCFAIIPTAWGVRAFERQRALRGVACAAATWREESDLGGDPQYLSIRDWLTRRGPKPTPRGVRRKARPVSGYLKLLTETGIGWGRPAISCLAKDGLYVNVGQTTLPYAMYLSWLRNRPDVAAVFMLHDTIPLDNPEFVTAQSNSAHGRLLRNTAAFASGIITPSQATLQRVLWHLRQFGRDHISAFAQPLPLAKPFRGPPKHDTELRKEPYFIVCGMIEPRKNHMLLLDLWKDMIRRDAASTPKLLIVGRRERPGPALVELLERAPDLSPYVLEITGLSTAALIPLISNARALLMPSLAEGFGLPVAEAIALGTPVIASALPAHHEASRDFATLLDPGDRVAWLESIVAHNKATGPAVISSPPNFLSTPDGYFSRLDEYLNSLENVPIRAKTSG